MDFFVGYQRGSLWGSLKVCILCVYLPQLVEFFGVLSGVQKVRVIILAHGPQKSPFVHSHLVFFFEVDFTDAAFARWGGAPLHLVKDLINTQAKLIPNAMKIAGWGHLVFVF